MVRRARARRSSSSGGRCSTAPACTRVPNRVAAVYLELAVLVRALEGLADAARLDSSPDRSSLWAGLFDLRETPARLDASTTCGRSPRSARRRRWGFSLPASLRVPPPHHRRRLGQPRPRRPLRAAAAARRDRERRDARSVPRRQGREPGRRVRAARRERARSSARSAATRSRTRRSPASREAGVELDVRESRRADGRRADHRRRGRRDDDRGLARRERAGRRLRARAGRRGALPAGDPGRGGRRRAGSRRRGCSASTPRPRGGSPSIPTSPSSTASSSSRSRARTGSSRSRSAPRAPSLLEDGEEVARATPPQVEVVDGTAAGDAFTACLLVSLLEGRDQDESLRRACAAGALAASRLGAQPSLPTAAEIDRPAVTCVVTRLAMTRYCRDSDHPRLRPGARRRDRAAARAREPGGRAARRHHRPRQPDAREDDGERAARARARRPHRHPGRGRRRPSARARAASSPRTSTATAASTARRCLRPGTAPLGEHAVDFMERTIARQPDGRSRSCRPAR